MSEAANTNSTPGEAEHLSPNQRALRRFKRNKPAMISGAFLLLFLLFVAIVNGAQWAASAKKDSGTIRLSLQKVTTVLPQAIRVSPEEVTDKQFAPPDPKNWLGTDVNGRDLFARICAGALISMLVGIVGAGVALVIGVAWGAVAGYIGGKLDELMMRAVDMLYCIPPVLDVIVLVAVFDSMVKSWLEKGFGPSATMYSRIIFMFFGIGAVSWLTMARIVRGQVLTLRHRQFVDASRTLGASHSRILWHHILPNIYGVIIVYLTLTVPAIILYESFLSYLGLGIQPPMASWGTLISEGAGQLNPIRIYWWLIVFPAGALISTLLALNFLGDGLRDAFDPRSEH